MEYALKSLKIIEKLKPKSQESAWVHYFIAHIHEVLQDLSSSIESYKIAFEISMNLKNQNDPLIYVRANTLAAMLNKAERFEEALEFAEISISKN